MTNALMKLWGARRQDVDVQPGHRYCRTRPDNVTELATVVGVRPDPMGIPHVLFALEFEKPTIGHIEGGRRVLALRAFTEAYHQRVS